MKVLDDILELRLFFFGTEVQKQTIYFDFIIPYFKNMNIAFYAERDWAGGPNYRIIIKNHLIDPSKIESDFKNFCNETEGILDDKEIEENVRAYKKNTDTIAQMERRQSREVVITNHLCLEYGTINEQYVKERFNSFHHFRVHTESLFLIQSFINKKYKYIKKLNSEARIKITARFLYDVLRLSKYDEKYSVMVYVSNIEGVLAIAETMQKKEVYVKTYEKIYEKLKPSQFFREQEYESGYGAEWNDTLDKIYKLITDNLDALSTQDEGYYSFDDQRDLLYSNINEINSPFHNQLVNYNLEELLQHEEHSIFQILINIVYKFIHMIEVNFNEKNVACYIVCQYVFDKNNTTWEKVLEDRGDSFVF